MPQSDRWHWPMAQCRLTSPRPKVPIQRSNSSLPQGIAKKSTFKPIRHSNWKSVCSKVLHVELLSTYGFAIRYQFPLLSHILLWLVFFCGKCRVWDINRAEKVNAIVTCLNKNVFFTKFGKLLCNCIHDIKFSYFLNIISLNFQEF